MEGRKCSLPRNESTFSGRSGTDHFLNHEDRDARPVPPYPASAGPRAVGDYAHPTGLRDSCSEDEDVSVRIANTRLARSPCLIGRWQLDCRTPRGKLIVQPIHIGNPKNASVIPARSGL